MTASGSRDCTDDVAALVRLRVVDARDLRVRAINSDHLQDWDAVVGKIAHPRWPNPTRTLSTGGSGARLDFIYRTVNRGERSMAVNVGTNEAREGLPSLLEDSEDSSVRLDPGMALRSEA